MSYSPNWRWNLEIFTTSFPGCPLFSHMEQSFGSKYRGWPNAEWMLAQETGGQMSEWAWHPGRVAGDGPLVCEEWGASCDSGMCDQHVAPTGPRLHSSSACVPVWAAEPCPSVCVTVSFIMLSLQCPHHVVCSLSAIRWFAGRRLQENHRRLHNYTDSTSTWEPGRGAPSTAAQHMINESTCFVWNLCTSHNLLQHGWWDFVWTTRYFCKIIVRPYFLAPALGHTAAPCPDSLPPLAVTHLTHLVSPSPAPCSIVGSGQSLTPLLFILGNLSDVTHPGHRNIPLISHYSHLNISQVLSLPARQWVSSVSC